MTPAPKPPPVPPPGDSPARFCADFAAVLDDRRVSLRAAADMSGWGKTTIADARRGPSLPNLDLIVDVLQSIGEPVEVRDHWTERHERLSSSDSAKPAAQAGLSKKDPRHDEGAVDEDEAGEQSGETAHRRSRRRLGVVAAVVLAAAVVSWLLLGPDEPEHRTLVVQNKVAYGPSALEEDDSPSYLASMPVTACANVPGCKLEGTDLASGDVVVADCQLQGATLTNADVQSPGVEDNPNIAASSLWYGIEWTDGRRGYLSEVYVAPTYRGGLQLPPC